jgi:hypothetical protein
VDARQPGNHLETQMVVGPLLGWMARELSTHTMAVERLMVGEIEPLLGLPVLKPRLTVFNKMVLLRVPRLQGMGAAAAILGDQKHQPTSIPLPQMITGARINQRLADGAETLTTHRRLELLCQRLHLRL